MTLVELMVALVIGLVVAAAAVAALLVARNGFTTVDATAQLRENARFAADLIQRMAVQAGFEDVAQRGFSVVPPADKPPAIQGYDNSILNAANPDASTNGSRSSGCGGFSDTSCVNGSDVLMIRFWGTSPGADPTVADGSMINCAGVGEPEGTDRATSIFHVVRSASGEPTLACTYRDTGGVWTTMPLVPGVESFQVLYGVDNVVPGVAPSGTTDSVPDRYLRASQLVVAGDAAATLANWRRVRSLRIGLLFREPTGTAQDRDATAVTYNVLGDGFSVSGDTLSQLAVPADGRLRQAMVFNIHLRNP
ncbi:MAG: PilW family protein [Burkholderiaceae bacterium]|nr:PilW family protein [Burkholderiaceae bacterium]